MKKWVQKLIEQMGLEHHHESSKKKKSELSDDRATVLYMLDVYSKHLNEIESHPVRKVRESFDELAKQLVDPSSKADPEKLLFHVRQFFSAYRVDEYTYIRKSFDDFKSILWDFVEQLADDSKFEQVADKDVKANLRDLREAVESESIEILRTKSREFIDSYVEYTTKRDERRTKRINSIKKNLDKVKKRLVEADQSMRTDHLTGAFNRMSYDEHLKQQAELSAISGQALTLCALDIDFFKKVNDTYGHDVGDFVLKECVRILHECYGASTDFVARTGGEEFAVILNDHDIQRALKRAEICFDRIRKEVFVHASTEIRFTISMGIAQYEIGETIDQWVKRADQALYDSKHSGRDRYTISEFHPSKIKRVS